MSTSCSGLCMSECVYLDTSKVVPASFVCVLRNVPEIMIHLLIHSTIPSPPLQHYPSCKLGSRLLSVSIDLEAFTVLSR